MSKHKAIPKRIRQQLYEKYNHRCAYCGCNLEYKDTKMLTDKQVKFGIDKEDGFDSPGYENGFLAVAFIEENGELDLVTVLLESM